MYNSGPKVKKINGFRILQKKNTTHLWDWGESDTRAFVGVVHEFIQMLHKLEQ